MPAGVVLMSENEHARSPGADAAIYDNLCRAFDPAREVVDGRRH